MVCVCGERMIGWKFVMVYNVRHSIKSEAIPIFTFEEKMAMFMFTL